MSRGASLRAPTVAALLVLATLAAMPAGAHETTLVEDRYHVTVGWLHEPPTEDAANGVTIRVGDTWTHLYRNVSDERTLFHTGDLVPNATFSYSFREELEGLTIPYHCALHGAPHYGGMGGNVTVTPDAPDVREVDVTLTADGFHPENLRVRPGTEVHWRNADDANHTITSGVIGDYPAWGAPLAELDLDVTIHHGDDARSLDVIQSNRGPGHYVAPITPGLSGDYTITLSGSLGETSFTLEDVHLDPVPDGGDGNGNDGSDDGGSGDDGDDAPWPQTPGGVDDGGDDGDGRSGAPILGLAGLALLGVTAAGVAYLRRRNG